MYNFLRHDSEVQNRKKAVQPDEIGSNYYNLLILNPPLKKIVDKSAFNHFENNDILFCPIQIGAHCVAQASPENLQS